MCCRVTKWKIRTKKSRNFANTFEKLSRYAVCILKLKSIFFTKKQKNICIENVIEQGYAISQIEKKTTYNNYLFFFQSNP